MITFDLYPTSAILRLKNLEEGLEGYFYDHGMRVIVHGKITNGRLVAAVTHDKNHTFSNGYSYGDWDLHDFEYIGGKDARDGLDGYLKFINKANTKQLEAYNRSKQLF